MRFIRKLSTFVQLHMCATVLLVHQQQKSLSSAQKKIHSSRSKNLNKAFKNGSFREFIFQWQTLNCFIDRLFTINYKSRVWHEVSLEINISLMWQYSWKKRVNFFLKLIQLWLTSYAVYNSVLIETNWSREQSSYRMKLP